MLDVVSPATVSLADLLQLGNSVLSHKAKTLAGKWSEYLFVYYRERPNEFKSLVN